MTRSDGRVTFKLLKNVPLPDPKGGKGKYEWPFERMKVGECFFVPTERADVIGIIKARGRVMRALNEWKHTGRRFATRASDDRKHLGVWRIA